MDHGGDEVNDLFRLKRGSNSPERLTDTKFTETDLHFSPDGKTLAYVADREKEGTFNLELMEIATRKARVVTHESINVAHPRWSRDGKTIALERTPDDQKGELLLVDVASGATRV